MLSGCKALCFFPNTYSALQYMLFPPAVQVFPNQFWIKKKKVFISQSSVLPRKDRMWGSFRVSDSPVQANSRLKYLRNSQGQNQLQREGVYGEVSCVILC